MSAPDDIDLTPVVVLTAGLLGEPECVLDVVARMTRLARPDRAPVIVADQAGGDLAQAARQAEAAGADFLAIVDGATCAHLFDIARAVGIPVVTVIEEVGAEAARRASAGGVVGLSVDGRAVELYRADLARRGLAVGSPADSTLLVVDGTVATSAADRAINAAQVLAERVVAYARRAGPLPPPFAWTEVGPD